MFTNEADKLLSGLEHIFKTEHTVQQQTAEVILMVGGKWFCETYLSLIWALSMLVRAPPEKERTLFRMSSDLTPGTEAKDKMIETGLRKKRPVEG